MREVFCVVGYGIPEDIAKDENYSIYLKLAFNTIFDRAANQPASIILSGGKTDCIPPFKRNEAAEMIRFFRGLMQRPAVKKATKTWKLVPEAKSISTMENVVFLSKMIGAGASLTIFCERTRVPRMKTLVKKSFGKKKVVVESVDFDQSIQRYLQPETIAEKEALALKMDLAGLASPAGMKKHHELTTMKIQFLRDHYGKTTHPEAVKKFWEEALKKLAK